MIRILILFFLLNEVNAQSISDVYTKSDFDPSGISVTKDSNVLLLSPLPFEMTYIVEFNRESYIETVQLDRLVFDISVYVFLNGNWECASLCDSQTFLIQQKVRYLMITYYSSNSEIYLLIE